MTYVVASSRRDYDDWEWFVDKWPWLSLWILWRFVVSEVGVNGKMETNKVAG